MTVSTGVLQAEALAYAERGWYVFPLTPGKSTPTGNCPDCKPTLQGCVMRAPHKAEDCPCIPRGRSCHGVRAATRKPHRIMQWWKDRPCGIGIACGLSGLVVIDCDAHGTEVPTRKDQILPTRPEAVIMAPRNGIDVFTMLASHHGDGEAHWSTAAVFTPRSGLHLLFEAEDAAMFRPDSSAALGWQVDVKAAWSYVVAPPTVKSSGAYRWMNPDIPVRTLPVWLREELVNSGRYRTTTPSPVLTDGSTPATETTYTRGQVLRAFHSELAELSGWTHGSINERLNRAAFSLGKFVAAGEATYNDVAKMLVDASYKAVMAKGVEWNAELAWGTAQRGLDAGIVAKL